jgi:hypothetical protein
MAIFEMVISSTGHLIPRGYDGLLNDAYITIKAILVHQLGKVANQNGSLYYEIFELMNGDCLAATVNL